MARLLCCLSSCLQVFWVPGQTGTESLLNTSQVPGAIPFFIAFTLGLILAKVGIISSLMKMKKLGSDGLKKHIYFGNSQIQPTAGLEPEALSAA